MKWPEPWEPVVEGGDALVRELFRAIAPDHPLHGREVIAVARHPDRDDVLFQALPAGPWAIVHLTGAPGRNPPTDLHPTLAEARLAMQDLD